MVIDILASKSPVLALAAAVGIGNYVGADDPTIDTVVMAKVSGGYMCSETLELTEEEVPSRQSLELSRCDESERPIGVRILII